MRHGWTIALLGALAIVFIIATSGDAQVGPRGARCSVDGSCSTGACGALGNGVGICVDSCPGMKCAPGQVADKRAGCLCIAESGPGMACSPSAPCANGGTCATFLSNVFGAGRTPGAGVCVPAGTLACNPAKTPSCTAPSSCAATAANGNGWCTSKGATLCRFDERLDGGTCKRLETLGESCGTCNAGQVCDPQLRRCVTPGFCTAEVAGNGIDEDCSGADAAKPKVCVRWDRDGDGHCEPGACFDVDAPAAGQRIATSCVAGDEAGQCASDPSRFPGAAPICMKDTDCNGNNREGCPSCMTVKDGLYWSCNNAIPGKRCISVNEPSDPDTWSDNFLCSTSSLGLRWSTAGAIAGMRCTRIFEDADPHTWNDNWLCVPKTSRYEFSWSQAGPIAGRSCLQWNEPADPHAWADNYLCWKKRPEEDPDPPVDPQCSKTAPVFCCEKIGGGNICHTSMQNCMNPGIRKLCVR